MPDANKNAKPGASDSSSTSFLSTVALGHVLLGQCDF